MAERLIALDTSFIVGYLDEKDVWRPTTIQLQTALEAMGYAPIIFDCVLAETISTFARRTHEKRRSAQLSQLLAQLKSQFPAKVAVWLYPDLPNMYDDVLALVEKTDGELNFNDALIALACQQRGIHYLASFDTDFDQITWLKRLSTPNDLD